MAPKQPPKPEFQEGERVLCFHGPLLYEAKCLQVATEDKQVRYLIHYSGWNKNWDEWVPESRVLKYSEANMQKQRDLQRVNQEQRVRGAAQGRKGNAAASASLQQQQQQQQVETLFQNIRITPSSSSSSSSASFSRPSASSATATVETPGRQTRKGKQKVGSGERSSSGASTSTGRGASQPPQRRRTRGHTTAKDQGASAPRTEAKVPIPEELKALLVKDWDLVTQKKQLFSLPAKKNIDSILEEYVTYKKSLREGDNTEYAAEDVVGGIKAHFDVLLGTQLLYEFERPQYTEILASHPDVPMSQLYGAPHLLRLFIPIGEILAQSPFDEKCLASLFNYLHDFLKYLAKNSSAFFNTSEYKEAPPEYHRKVA